MRYKAIMFDLDGTLLPMDIETFVDAYFKLASEKMIPYGFEEETLIDAIWTGVSAMVHNDGSKTNQDVFWSAFCEITNAPRSLAESLLDEFYAQDFHGAKAYTEANPYAKKVVRLAHKLADQVILATNPLFPMCGQETRLSWIGLSKDDFDLVTSYENDSYCKPNPKYFLDVCRRIDVDPEDCLLIGNDEHEDMYAGSQAGLDCYLVTDSSVASDEYTWTGARGSMKDLFRDMKNFLR